MQENKQNEVALREMEHWRAEEFRALIEHAPDPAGRFDRQFRHDYVNPTVLRITGATLEKFLGKTHREIGMLVSEAQRIEDAIAHVFATGEEMIVETEVTLLTGQHVLENRLIPEFNANGEVETVLSVGRDMTTRVEAEKAFYWGSSACKRWC
jgi:PAS domain S-box-containing protein